ncbi:hypothetical protein HN011_010668 [Eciton burchellii]|nr:hypothetical protein HN011_010668 [Eciton burchellii]
MARKMHLLFLLVVACILIYETAAQRPKACLDPIIPGKITAVCHKTVDHFAFEADSNACVRFQYTSCGVATQNNFVTKEACEAMCVRAAIN